MYWLRVDFLEKLIANELSGEDLSVKRPVKTGVIFFPDQVIKAPGRSYLHCLAFLHQDVGESTTIQIKNKRIYDRDSTETMPEELAWITMLSNGTQYSGLINLTLSQLNNKLESEDSGLETYKEKKLVEMTNKVLVQLLKYFNSNDAINNNLLEKSTYLEPKWLENK